ncbi:MAG TPA: DUF2723 domain-containing protein [Gemmatimonas aurantiaca]|uniref:DUF2723 domain-containing protein n=1 Tax=Gemmatimonas aurantiaca TaxID=173480 RepID=A0A3D4VDS9_9BACT|nr:DUF2723 domain-containing protein [Gemmatimonas aurantiaca]HCT58882.1 DUF2723 domain-containing protein [Gemmatimonas aurantiaca]
MTDNSSTTFLRRSVLSPLGGAACALTLILAGFANLWSGGTDLASVLLTVGYIGAVPAALWWFGNSDPVAASTQDAPPYAVAASVGAVVLLLYVVTLAPTTAMWDASEYIAAAKVLGIPHPPGNPLFVLVAHAFALIPFPLTYAGRVNLLAATTSAISAAIWFLVAHRTLRGWQLPKVPRLVIAAAASTLGATCFTVWNQSVVNEKVYTVAMLGLAASAWCALQWHDTPAHGRRSTSWLLLFVYICAVGYTNHPAGFLPLPAFGVYVLWRRVSTLLQWRTLLAAGGMLCAGLTLFLYQPIRAAHHPAINVGEPTACVSAPEFSCTFSKETYRLVMANVQREQYGGHKVAQRQAPLAAQFGMWWQYFEWQMLRDAAQQMPGLQRALAIVALALGLFGGWTHFRRDRESFAFFGPLVFTLTPALIVYLNFRYGATQAPDLGESVEREVRDRDYFFLWSFATWSVWMALGLGALWQTLAERFANARAPQRSWLVTSVVMLAALIPLVGNAGAAPRHGQNFTSAWARDLLESVSPNGILVTNGDNDSFPVWYAQLVEGVRPDVTIAITPYLNADWFARHLVSDVDRIPPYVELQQPALFEHGQIRATIPPGLHLRDQLVVLQLIKNDFPRRPIHFSVGGYPRGIGLQDYVVNHGLTQRLLERPASEYPAYLSIGGAYVDTPVSDSLWAQYQGPGAVLAQGQWIDTPSVGIPYAYSVIGQLIGYSKLARGDSLGAERVLLRADSIARVIGIAQ